MTADPTSISSRLFLPAGSLCWREIIRFVRQRSRIIGALATPILFWIVIGAGMGRSFRADMPGGTNFIEYFFPGTLVMILLFTAIFSEISIIEDRREGFLQSVLVAPVSRMAIVLGKVLGGTLLASAQGILFLLLAPMVGIKLDLSSFLAACRRHPHRQLCPVGPRILHRLADEFHAGVSRHHESLSHSDVVPFRRHVSRPTAPWHHAPVDEP